MREGGVPDREVELAGLGAGKPETRIEDLVGAEQVGIAQSDLLIENADVAVGLTVERQRNGRVVDPRSPCGR